MGHTSKCRNLVLSWCNGEGLGRKPWDLTNGVGLCFVMYYAPRLEPSGMATRVLISRSKLLQLVGA